MKRNGIFTLVGGLCLFTMIIVTACAAPMPTVSPSPTPTPTPTASPSPAPTPTQQIYKWRCQTACPPVVMEWMYEPWAEDIYQMSNGRMQIELFPDGALVAIEETSDALSKGILEMAVHACVYEADKKPVLNVLGLPYSHFNGDDVEMLLHFLGLEELMQEAYAELGVQWVHEMLSSDYFIITTKPVSNLKDLSKLKIRAAGNFAPMYEKLGVATTYYPPAEFYTNLSRGIIDGLIWGGAVDYDDLGLFDYCKYIIRPSGLNPTLETVFLGKELWDSLPEDAQEILTAATQRLSRRVYLTYMSQESERIMMLKKEKGVTEVTLPEEDQKEILEAALETWDDTAKMSPEAAQAIEIVKGWLKASGHMQ